MVLIIGGKSKLKLLLKFLTALLAVLFMACPLESEIDNKKEEDKPVVDILEESIATSDIDGATLTFSKDVVSKKPDLYWALTESGTYYLCKSSIGESIMKIEGLNPDDTYYFKLKYSDGTESKVISSKPEARLPSGVNELLYKDLVGTWKCVSTGTNGTEYRVDHAIMFTEGYKLLRFFPDGAGSYTHFERRDIFKADGATVNNYKYRISGNELVITVSYTNTNTIAEVRYEKITDELNYFNLFFKPDNLSFPPLMDGSGYYFKEGDNLTNLNTYFEMSPKTLISPLPTAKDYSSKIEYKIIGNTGVKHTWPMVAKTLNLEPGNMLYNGTIDNGGHGWGYWIGDNEKANATFDNSNGEIVVDVVTPASLHKEGWKMTWPICVGPFRPENFITFTNGKKYRVSFDAKASVNRNIVLSIAENGRDLDGDGNSYTRYLDGSYDLTTTMTRYTSEFFMANPTDNLPNINFEFAHEAGKVHIDNIKIEEIDVDFSDPNYAFVSFRINGGHTKLIDFNDNSNSLPKLDKLDRPNIYNDFRIPGWGIVAGEDNSKRVKYMHIVISDNPNEDYIWYQLDPYTMYSSYSRLNHSYSEVSISVVEPKPWSIGDMLTGSFSGELYNDNGYSINITDGNFRVKVTAPES